MRNSARLHNPASVASLDGIELACKTLPQFANAPSLSPYRKLSSQASLESATEDLISWMADERALSVNYQLLTRQSLKKFAKWIRETHGGTSLNSIRIADLTDYLAAKKQSGLEPGSLRLIVISLRMFFGFLKSRGDLKKRPVTTVGSAQGKITRS
jgi:site-specific recombinase XerD